jgi:2-oxoglutarate ferredoxin oxidoreductase subunit gamma
MNKQVANIVLLGVLIETSKVVSLKAMQKAIALHVSQRFRAINLRALKIGMALGRPAHG